MIWEKNHQHAQESNTLTVTTCDCVCQTVLRANKGQKTLSGVLVTFWAWIENVYHRKVSSSLLLTLHFVKYSIFRNLKLQDKNMTDI